MPKIKSTPNHWVTHYAGEVAVHSCPGTQQTMMCLSVRSARLVDDMWGALTGLVISISVPFGFARAPRSLTDLTVRWALRNFASGRRTLN